MYFPISKYCTFLITFLLISNAYINAGPGGGPEEKISEVSDTVQLI